MDWKTDGTEVRITPTSYDAGWRLTIYREDGLTLNAFELKKKIYVMEGVVDFQADNIVVIDKTNGFIHQACEDKAIKDALLALTKRHYNRNTP